MLHSQITCHTFLCLYQPRSLWNWIMKTHNAPKELVFLNAVLLTVPLYIQWDGFIIVRVIFSTPSQQFLSNFMLAFKILRLNLLKIVTLLTLKVVLGYYPNRNKTILKIFKPKFSNLILTETIILFSQLSVDFQNKLSLNLFIWD